MKNSLSERFSTVDNIFSNRGLFFAEKEVETPTMKKYAVKVLKDNDKELEELSEKFNTLVSEKQIREIDHNESQYYSNQIEALSQELEKRAEIICTLYPDLIKFEIKINENCTIFEFKEDDYWTPLINYLHNNLGQTLLK
ncbi:hypothetical protein [Bacillus swezeyi]|uniref:hypothetical protein n=1 Tax=Bacillus swezeyi TaxID=1925020 RepID=UPI0027DAFEF8|nr:hypothetical protein [Bacillus swezeyi]